MSKELIERLRYESPGPNHIATEAADRIEQLETERDQLREQVKMLRDGRQAEREEINQDAERYRWLRTHALQRAWVSLGTDCDGENFVDLRCEFKVPEPPNLPYEDDEGLEWSDKDFDSAIDTAIRARGDTK